MSNWNDHVCKILTDVRINSVYLSEYHRNRFYKYKSFEDMLTNLADNRLLKCYVHKGIHITINTIAELQNAKENIKKLYI